MARFVGTGVLQCYFERTSRKVMPLPVDIVGSQFHPDFEVQICQTPEAQRHLHFCG